MFDTLKYFLVCYLFIGFPSFRNIYVQFVSIISCLSPKIIFSCLQIHMSTVFFLHFLLRISFCKIGLYFQNSVILIWRSTEVNSSDANFHIVIIVSISWQRAKKIKQVWLVLFFELGIWLVLMLLTWCSWWHHGWWHPCIAAGAQTGLLRDFYDGKILDIGLIIPQLV